MINALTGQKKLAFTSNTPGRTQTINFYRVDEDFYLVDLPGYGYARVPKGFTDQWKILIEQYLNNRETLVLSCLILDTRRGWMEKDLDLKRWLEHYGRPYLVVATKTDKLNQSEQERGLRAIRKEGVEPLPFSALSWPGSEGNLASNNENTSPTVANNLPQEKSEKPTEKTPTRESAPPETVDKATAAEKPAAEKPAAEKPHRPERASKSAAAAAAPPEGKAVDAKTVEAKPAEPKPAAEAKPAAPASRSQARRPAGASSHCRRHRPPSFPVRKPTSARSAANRAPPRPPKRALPRSTSSNSRT